MAGAGPLRTRTPNGSARAGPCGAEPRAVVTVDEGGPLRTPQEVLLHPEPPARPQRPGHDLEQPAAVHVPRALEGHRGVVLPPVGKLVHVPEPGPYQPSHVRGRGELGDQGDVLGHHGERGHRSAVPLGPVDRSTPDPAADVQDLARRVRVHVPQFGGAFDHGLL
jgi:hypothetical protein